MTPTNSSLPEWVEDCNHGFKDHDRLIAALSIAMEALMNIQVHTEERATEKECADAIARIAKLGEKGEGGQVTPKERAEKIVGRFMVAGPREGIVDYIAAEIEDAVKEDARKEFTKGLYEGAKQAKELCFSLGFHACREAARLKTLCNKIPAGSDDFKDGWVRACESIDESIRALQPEGTPAAGTK